MINRLVQESFTRESFDSSRLNLHTTSSGPSRDLVLMVHGLNGHGYRTWKGFPSLVFEGHAGEPTDVALYDYPNGLRAVATRGTNLDECTRQLAGHLRTLAEIYEDIYILGHSLGGLLAAAAIQDFLFDRHLQPVSNVAALILFASPRAGSNWARIWPLRERGWLRPSSPQQIRSEEFFSTYVETEAIASPAGRKFLVPLYCCTGIRDALVDHLSAKLGAHKLQRFPLDGSHGSIVKPSELDQQQVKWLTKIRNDVRDIRDQCRREREHSRIHAIAEAADPVIVTELRTEVGGLEWEEIYNQVRFDASTSALAVHDRRDVPGRPPDLLMTVHRTETVLRPQSPSRSAIHEAYEQQRADGQLTVGVSPIGERFDDAQLQIFEWVPSPLPGSFFVNGVPDLKGLIKVMSRWIDVVASRNPRRGSRIASLLDRDDDPLDELGRPGYL